MNVKAIDNWSSGNYRYLIASVAAVRLVLESYVAQWQNQRFSDEQAPIQAAIDAASALLPTPSALQQLCREFKLSDFERDLLLLCVGMELDPSFADLCARSGGGEELGFPTFNLAMSAFAAPHWDAISPHRPLRYWQLIEVGGGKTITQSPLRINERILHYLMGVDCLDEAFKGIIEPVYYSGELVRSHDSITTQIAAILSNKWGNIRQLPITDYPLPIVQLCGDEVGAKLAIASTACEISGMKLAAISARVIPTVTAELNNLILLWQREARLSRCALLLDCDEWEREDGAKENAIAQLMESITTGLIITTRDRRPAPKRPLITFDVHPPTKQEQLEIWQNALGEIAPSLNGQVEVLVDQFNLNAPTIYAVCSEALGRIAGESKDDNSPLPLGSSAPLPQLWDICRAQSRPRLDDLAQRIDPAATWDDLVLPEAPRQTLREIAAHVRQRTKVYQQWGFASKGGRGLGISALFAGSSGTGKTMSAEVLAGELQLDLYRIDLSSVVSKYIGETEKNLRRVFDAAEGGATILLFDEADAIFGKRSDVKDSHDRYANMEVSYLLQRMESYQGLAILTTNLKDSLDTAFLRRIRFVVKYAFPDAKDRAEIWRRIFPKNTPTEKLDFVKLARLNVAGGNIRNIALNAAFMAADAGEPVQMKHLLEAARTEYVKLERTLTDAEVKGWV
ncbi:ATP-binding protein [Microseira wollei]|uniref:ATPase central domain-containing protein n=1 Tax=Microseira wollei NIES-4236 TaxID=2530354 RepID=A0AAV3XQA0_9CYAN|nr:AAA family ATPase [Microseira wollei]GET42712.1 ATPase central domain-containing protein [Microseira wollei NIES-4236]